MDDLKSFRYTLNHKNQMLVVSLHGEITSQVIPAMDACRQEIQGFSELRYLILYFQDVESICPEGVQILAQIQREARARSADLRLVSLKESIRQRLVKMGVIRALEVSEDLKSVILSFARGA